MPFFLDVDDYGQQVRELQARAAARAHSHGMQIDVVDIRAWRPRSASKAVAVEEAARYQAPGMTATPAEPTPKPGRRKSRPSDKS